MLELKYVHGQTRQSILMSCCNILFIGVCVKVLKELQNDGDDKGSTDLAVLKGTRAIKPN